VCVCVCVCVCVLKKKTRREGAGTKRAGRGRRRKEGAGPRSKASDDAWRRRTADWVVPPPPPRSIVSAVRAQKGPPGVGLGIEWYLHGSSFQGSVKSQPDAQRLFYFGLALKLRVSRSSEFIVQIQVSHGSLRSPLDVSYSSLRTCNGSPDIGRDEIKFIRNTFDGAGCAT